MKAKLVLCVGIVLLFLAPLSSIESTVLGVQTDIVRVNMDAFDGGGLRSVMASRYCM